MFPILNHSICLQLCDINSAKNGNSTSKGRVWQNMDDTWKNCNRAYKELKKAALQCNGSEFDQLTMLANSFNVHYSVTTVHGVATSLEIDYAGKLLLLDKITFNNWSILKTNFQRRFHRIVVYIQFPINSLEAGIAHGITPDVTPNITWEYNVWQAWTTSYSKI